MSPLRDRRFALLVAGQAINGIGSWCALIALWGYATYKYDANAGQIALLSLSWSLPAALLGPIGGVPVDRFGPRRALVLTDCFAAIPNPRPAAMIAGVAPPNDGFFDASAAYVGAFKDGSDEWMSGAWVDFTAQ